MLQGTVRQIKITPKFILHQNAKFSTRQYFRLYGIVIRQVITVWRRSFYYFKTHGSVKSGPRNLKCMLKMYEE